MKQLITVIAGVIMAFLLPETQSFGQGQKLAGSNSDPGLTPGGASNQVGMGSLYSPNLYDGTVNISIPIYQYDADGANYGISLGFNTRGIKLNDYASEVGLGWALSAFGLIKRSIKDLPDELHLLGDSIITHYEVNVQDTIQVIVNPQRTFKGKLAWFNENLQQATDTTIYRDSESDDFDVTVGKLSFTFNLGKDGFVFTRPQRNVKVEMLLNGVVVTAIPTVNSGLTSLEFRITDEQGNQYYFTGGNTVGQQMTDKFGYGEHIGFYQANTTWVIKKVTLANGNEIKYTYLPAELGNVPAYKRFTLQSRIDPNDFPHPSGAEVQTNQDSEVSLDKIEYPNNITAKIVYDTGNRLDRYGHAIKEIQISSGGNMLRYKMEYAYWLSRTNVIGQPTPGLEVPYTTAYGGPGSNYLTHRLKLKGIRLSGTSGTPEEPYYSFDYHNLQFPRRYTCSEDFFGYFNGQASVTFQSTPATNWDFPFPYHQRHFNNISYGGMIKTPNVDSMKLGMLTKIKNAFGGEVAFEFDGHELSNVLTTTTTPGLPANDDHFFGKDANDGLRIKSITETDKFHPGNFRKTTFEFLGGQRFLSGAYYHYPTKLYGPQKNPVIIVMEGLPMSIRQFVSGSNHGYSSASIEERNELGHMLSRKEVTFTNFADALTNNQPRYTLVGSKTHFFKYPYTEKQYIRDWELGLPLKTKEYDQNSRVTMETFNQYNFTLDSMSSKNQIENRKKVSILWENPALTYHTYDSTDDYRPYRGKVDLVQTVNKKYLSDVAFVLDTLKYEYDSRHNLKKMIARNSKSEEVQTIFYYNYDVNTPVSGGNFTPLDGLEKLVGTQKWKRIAGNTDPLPQGGTLQSGLFNSYVAVSNGTSHKKIWHKTLYTSLLPAEALSYSQYLGTGSYNTTALKSWAVFNSVDLPGFIKTSEVQQFDSKGNPMETATGEQRQYSSVLWDTINGQRIAEAVNAHYNDIAYTSFENNEPGPGGSLSVTRGNISYETSQVVTSPAPGSMSGNAAFRLSSALGGQQINGSYNLTQGKQYRLSFWASGGVPQVAIGGTNLTVSATVKEVNTWKQYIVVFSPSGTSDKFRITWPGTGIIYLDEVRLHPVESRMQSWTYAPLFGISSETDVHGRITYYQYDSFGRSRLTRDQEGNVLSKSQYILQQ